MQTKQEFAQFITQLFASDALKQSIAHHLNTCKDKKRHLGFIVGDILTFYTITRSTNCSKKLLNRVIENAVKHNYDYGFLVEIVYEELAEQNKKQNKPTNANYIIHQVIENYVTNGFLLHAFTSANLKSVLEKGLNPRHRLFEEERKLLNSVSMYDFEHTSNRLFVTGNYRVLYSYGSLSPEWVYYYFKNSDVMYDKNYTNAYQIFMQKARLKLNCPNRLKQTEQAAKRVFRFYLKKEHTIQIAVLDKLAKDSNDKPLFKNYNYDEDDLDAEIYLDELKTKHYIKKEDILTSIHKIIQFYSPYERSALTQFKKEDFGLIELPQYQEFEKYMTQQNEVTLNPSQTETNLEL
jgi:hypothetical protein